MDFVYNDILMILNFSMVHYPSRNRVIKMTVLTIVKILDGVMLLTLSPEMNIPIMMSLHNRQFLNKPPSEGQHDYENPTPNTLTTILGHSFGTTIKRGMMYY